MACSPQRDGGCVADFDDFQCLAVFDTDSFLDFSAPCFQDASLGSREPQDDPILEVDTSPMSYANSIRAWDEFSDLNRISKTTSSISEDSGEPITKSVERTGMDNDDYGNDHKNRKKKRKGSVAYPFALVKPPPEGHEMTLGDINQRILMPPTRTMRHPIGDFANHRIGEDSKKQVLGKSVMGLTKIHTQGRGTITIIRTKGSISRNQIIPY